MTRFIRVLSGLIGAIAIVASCVVTEDPGNLTGLAYLVGGSIAMAFAIWPRRGANAGTIERSILSVALALTTVFAMLSIQVLRIQVIHGSAIAGRIGSDPTTGDALSNPRMLSLALSPNRGAIVDRNGRVLAMTELRDGKPVRVYPVADASYVTGYYSPLRYGAAGIEATYDGLLSGATAGNEIENEMNQLLGRSPQGADVHLTIDSDLQSLADQTLAGRAGAVVLMDVQTGALLVLASGVHPDPNGLNAYDGESAAAAEQYWNSLLNDPTRPLLPRATQGLYTPGSTFKVLTAAAAIESGVSTPDTLYTDDGTLMIDGRLLIENNRPDDTQDVWTLRDGIAYSLNLVLAQVGLDLGGDQLTTYAERFGFGEEMRCDVPVATSTVANSADFLDADVALADTAFGQGELQATPLQMVLVASAMANGGVIMQPYLVSHATSEDGLERYRHNPNIWREPIAVSTADQVSDMMVNAVTNGYASAAAIDGYVVGGKTGTAETGDGDPHAWFIGFIGDPEPRYAIAVVLEHGGTGLGEPIAIARQVMLAAMTE